MALNSLYCIGCCNRIVFYFALRSKESKQLFFDNIAISIKLRVSSGKGKDFSRDYRPSVTFRTKIDCRFQFRRYSRSIVNLFLFLLIVWKMITSCNLFCHFPSLTFLSAFIFARQYQEGIASGHNTVAGWNFKFQRPIMFLQLY